MNELADKVASFPVDKNSVPQDALDLAKRERRSLFPWRGQFSPGLIDLLLSMYADRDHVVLDPFAGSGTTLFEATRRQLACYGAEINPAAATFASLAKFANLPIPRRQRIVEMGRNLIERQLSLTTSIVLSGRAESGRQEDSDDLVRQLLARTTNEPLLHELLASAVMIAMGDSSTLDLHQLLPAFRRNAEAVLNLPPTSAPCEVMLADARGLPLPSGTIDLVITSPPYINVFNYHQNYRWAMELLEWHLLSIARSEIGSNRKHRGNRFLTVVQYCLDMQQVMWEMRRVLKPGRNSVIVIGRESNVRSVSFKNGHLIGMVAALSGFKLSRWWERKFTNRFGAAIYEDVLTLTASEEMPDKSEDTGRQVGVWALRSALNAASDETVIRDIQDALTNALEVRPSPHFDLDKARQLTSRGAANEPRRRARNRSVRSTAARSRRPMR